MKRFLLLIAMFLAPVVAVPQSLTGVITGRILGINGQPAAGVRVTAVAAPQGNQPAGVTAMVSLAETDAAGRYRLENIPPGRYLVSAGLLDLATYYPGTPSVDKAMPVVVTGTAVVSDIDLIMAADATGVTVSGRFIAPSGQIVSAAQVRLLPLATTSGGASSAQTIPVSQDGSFTFEKVRPGSYRIELATSAALIAQPLSVTVVDRSITDLALVGAPTINVTGSVVVEGGGLRPRFTVAFVPYQGGRSLVSADIGTTGTFTARVTEGEYRFSWTALPAGYTLQSVMSGSTDLLREPLKVLPSAVAPPVVITLGVTSPPPWVRVSGRVRDAGNGPLPARLILEPASSSVSASILPASVIDKPEATPAADGLFEFPMAATGAYVIRATTMAWPLASVVVGNKDVTGVDVVVPRTRELNGRVFIEGEGPSQFPPRLSFALTDSLVASTVTVPVLCDGTFRAAFPEGERSVTLSAPGFRVKSLTYGDTDLSRKPMKVAVTDRAELQITLGASSGRAISSPCDTIGVMLNRAQVGELPDNPDQLRVFLEQLASRLPGAVDLDLSAIAALPPQQAPPPPSTPERPRLTSTVMSNNCLFCPQPAYPELARVASVSDTVVLSVTVGKDGTVIEVRVVRGHALLQQAAIDAVRQWRYKPQMLNGEPVEAQGSVSINFPSN